MDEKRVGLKEEEKLARWRMECGQRCSLPLKIPSHLPNLSLWYPPQVCLRHSLQWLLKCQMACLPPVPKQVSHFLTQLLSTWGEDSDLVELGCTDMCRHSRPPWCSQLGAEHLPWNLYSVVTPTLGAVLHAFKVNLRLRTLQSRRGICLC